MDISRSRMHEILSAEQEGRLVILPCKVGDTVWAYSDFGHTIVPYIVESINLHVGTQQINCLWYTNLDCMEGVEFEPSDFGKTVFLTLEAAEQALLKRRI